MMKKQALFLVLLVAALVALAGCSQQESSSNAVTSKARIEEIHTEEGTVVLNHEEIPGLMMAMTMPFRVADSGVLKDVKEGDAVEFDVEQRAQGLTVVAFRKIHPGELNLGAAGAFEGKATVLVVNKAANSIAIIATGIPGIPYDPNDPQTLVYEVEDPKLLEGIEDDDVVEIRLEDRSTKEGGGQLVVTKLKKVKE